MAMKHTQFGRPEFVGELLRANIMGTSASAREEFVTVTARWVVLYSRAGKSVSLNRARIRVAKVGVREPRMMAEKTVPGRDEGREASGAPAWVALAPWGG